MQGVKVIYAQGLSPPYLLFIKDTHMRLLITEDEPKTAAYLKKGIGRKWLCGRYRNG